MSKLIGFKLSATNGSDVIPLDGRFSFSRTLRQVISEFL